MKQTLVYVARHGSTNDSKKGIFRGQRDSALDKQGFLDAHKLREFFEKKKWESIFCSPMTRAIQTATIICDDQSEAQPITTPGLEPWDVGYLTGKDKKEYGKEFDHYVVNDNDVPKGGESRRQFEDRVFPLLGEAMEIGLQQEVPCIVVAHSSIIHCLAHLLYGENHPNISVDPGGVVEIYYEDGEFKERAALKEGTDDSSFASKNS